MFHCNFAMIPPVDPVFCWGKIIRLDVARCFSEATVGRKGHFSTTYFILAKTHSKMAKASIKGHQSMISLTCNRSLQFLEVPRLRCGAARVALRQLLEVHLRRQETRQGRRTRGEKGNQGIFLWKDWRITIGQQKNYEKIKSGCLRMKEPRLPRDTCFVRDFSSGVESRGRQQGYCGHLRIANVQPRNCCASMKIPRSRLSWAGCRDAFGMLGCLVGFLLLWL